MGSSCIWTLFAQSDVGVCLTAPIGVAIHRARWPWVLCIASGILSAGAGGPLLGLTMVVATLWIEPKRCLWPESLAMTILWWMDGNMELTTRASTGPPRWCSNVDLGAAQPKPFRNFKMQSAYYPPTSHQNATLMTVSFIGPMGGIGAWLAWGMLLTLLWQHTRKSGRAAIAALSVGALTQDVFGDLEVIRALCAWTLLDSIDSMKLDVSDRASAGYARREHSSVPTNQSP